MRNTVIWQAWQRAPNAMGLERVLMYILLYIYLLYYLILQAANKATVQGKWGCQRVNNCNGENNDVEENAKFRH